MTSLRWCTSTWRRWQPVVTLRCWGLFTGLSEAKAHLAFESISRWRDRQILLAGVFTAGIWMIPEMELRGNIVLGSAPGLVAIYNMLPGPIVMLQRPVVPELLAEVVGRPGDRGLHLLGCFIQPKSAARVAPVGGA